MEIALRARLLAEAGVKAILDNRVYWIDRPQASALPAMTVQTVAPGRAYTMAGPSGLHGTRIQFDLWGSSFADVLALFNALLAALEKEANVDGIRFGMSFLDTRRDPAPEEVAGSGPVYRISADFIIWWQPL